MIFMGFLYHKMALFARLGWRRAERFLPAGRLKDIPAVFVNGRYDMICPPVTAYSLHRMLPLSRLVIAEASGHSLQERAVEQALLNAMRDFE